MECYVIFGVLMLLQLSNQVDWLPDLIIRQGSRMELECSTTNETISVSWWWMLRKDETVHIRKTFTLVYEQANLNHSGIYECFDGYNGTKEFRLFMRRVLVVDSSCNESSPRNDSSMTMECEVKFRHVEFDQVEIFWKCNGMTVKGNCTPSTDPQQCRKLVSIQTFPAIVLTSWNFFVQFWSASLQLWPNNISALATTTNNSIRRKTTQQETTTDPVDTDQPTLVGILSKPLGELPFLHVIVIAGFVIGVLVIVLLTSCCFVRMKLGKPSKLRQDSYELENGTNMLLRKTLSNSSDPESDHWMTNTPRHDSYIHTYEEINKSIQPGCNNINKNNDPGIYLNPPVGLLPRQLYVQGIYEEIQIYSNNHKFRHSPRFEKC